MDEPFHRFEWAVRSMFLDLNTKIPDLSPRFRLGVTSETHSLRFQNNASTVKRYATTLSRLLLYLVRSVATDDLAQREGLRPDSPLVASVVDLRDTALRLDRWVDPTNEVNSPPEAAQRHFRSAVEAVVDAILEPQGMLATVSNPVYRWFIYMLLNRSPKSGVFFLGPGAATHAIAEVLWTLQAVKAVKLSILLPDGTSQATLEHELTRHCSGFGHQATSYLGAVSAQWGLCNASAREQVNLRCLWQGDTIVMPQRGCRRQFTVVDLQQTVNQALNELRTLLDDQLFLGCHSRYDSFDLNALEDDWTCQKGGYSTCTPLQEACSRRSKDPRKMALWADATTPD